MNYTIVADVMVREKGERTETWCTAYLWCVGNFSSLLLVAKRMTRHVVVSDREKERLVRVIHMDFEAEL